MRCSHAQPNIVVSAGTVARTARIKSAAQYTSNATVTGVNNLNDKYHINEKAKNAQVATTQFFNKMGTSIKERSSSIFGRRNSKDASVETSTNPSTGPDASAAAVTESDAGASATAVPAASATPSEGQAAAAASEEQVSLDD